MRRELGKRVRVEFASQIKSRLPQFQLVKGQGLGAGIYLYQWKLAPELSFLLTLQLSIKAWEEFTVEMAFSKSGRFHDHFIFCKLPNFPRCGMPAVAACEEGRFRLSHLWRFAEKNMDFWWEITPHLSLSDLADGRWTTDVPLEVAIQNVQPQVTAAIDKIIEHGLPFIREFALCRGIELTQ
jgi:hypothetical protein